MHVYFTAISPIAVTTSHSLVKSSTPWQSDALHPLGKCVLKRINLNVILGWIANQQILPSTESAWMEIDIIPLFSKHGRFCFYGVFLCLIVRKISHITSKLTIDALWPKALKSSQIKLLFVPFAAPAAAGGRTQARLSLMIWMLINLVSIRLKAVFW